VLRCLGMDERKRLEELRGQLAEIDHQILRQLERRARIAQDIIRMRTGTARSAPVADGHHIQALEQAAQPPLPASAVRPVFVAIDAACRVLEVVPRVVFLGTEGGFGWTAAQDHFGQTAELVHSETVASAIDEVARSRAEFAVVPYESLKDGPIFPTIQAIAGADLKLVGEHELTQTLVLVNASGSAGDAEKIFVAATDRFATVKYLQANHPHATVIEVGSPIAALEQAREGAQSAAIVPRGALAREVDLRIARENIGDEGEVRIRYGVVSRLPAPRSGADATALLFGVHDRPGALHEVLHYFKDKNVNLRRIQSRPIPGEGWEFVFYVEVFGHATDRNLVAALEGIKREAKMLKIVGSFPLERPERSPVEPADRLR